MNKVILSDKQSIYLIIIFILGTATMLMRGIEAKQDLGLAIILALVIASLIALILARLHYIFPNKDLVDMLEICFGKYLGKLVGLLYVWFAFHLSTLIVADLGYVFLTTTFEETPIIVLNIFGVIFAIYAVKEGVKVMSRWTQMFLPIVLFFSFLLVALLIPNMNINNIRPMLSNGAKPIIEGAISVFGFPFGEIVVFTMFFSNFITRKSPYKVYSIGLLISGIILLVLGVVYVMVLGVNSASSLYFPAHSVAARINIGEFVQRIELVIDVVFILATFAKLCICLYATCNGITKIFNYKDYRFVVAPVGFLIINLSYFLHDSVTEWLQWSVKVYPYYAFPFQVIFPIIILITAEIRKKVEF